MTIKRERSRTPLLEHGSTSRLRMLSDFAGFPSDVNAPAWEEIEAGRYMPRRIRGSFPGRELG